MSEEEKATSEEVVEQKKISDKMLVIGIIIIFLVFGSIMALRFIIKAEEPKTIEEMHALNLAGKLKPSLGYIYNGYSFVNVSNFWYTQFNSDSGKTQYDINFRFGPNQVSEVKVFGEMDVALFNEAKEAYVTFNPKGFGGDFTTVTLAVSDLDQHLIKVFKKTPVAACDRNETYECEKRPIVNCSNTKDLIFYFKESDTAYVVFENNCILINGNSLDLVKAVDRLLLTFYDIME